MDPAYFKPEDIRMQKCAACSEDIEFWKDDIFLLCPRCEARNTNARIQHTCLAWCKEASICIGNMDIEEWINLHKSRKDEA